MTKLALNAVAASVCVLLASCGDPSERRADQLAITSCPQLPRLSSFSMELNQPRATVDRPKLVQDCLVYQAAMLTKVEGLSEDELADAAGAFCQPLSDKYEDHLRKTNSTTPHSYVAEINSLKDKLSVLQKHQCWRVLLQPPHSDDF